MALLKNINLIEFLQSLRVERRYRGCSKFLTSCFSRDLFSKVSTTNGDVKPKVEEVKEEKAGSSEKATSAETSIPDSSVDESGSLPTSDSSTANETVVAAPAKEDTCNGEVTNSKADLKDSVTSSSNGEVNSSPSKKGKALGKYPINCFRITDLLFTWEAIDFFHKWIAKL